MPHKTTAFFNRNCHDYGAQDEALRQRGLDYNAKWFQNNLDLKIPVYDIGPRGNYINSSFYNLEVGRSWGYPYLTPVKYNSYLGGKLRVTRF